MAAGARLPTCTAGGGPGAEGQVVLAVEGVSHPVPPHQRTTGHCSLKGQGVSHPVYLGSVYLVQWSFFPCPQSGAPPERGETQLHARLIAHQQVAHLHTSCSWLTIGGQRSHEVKVVMKQVKIRE